MLRMLPAGRATFKPRCDMLDKDVGNRAFEIFLSVDTQSFQGNHES